jgi:hypothetical protein
VAFGHEEDAGATCETIWCFQGGNITCENHKEVIQGCHCLYAPKHGKGYVLHLQSGSTQNCNTTHC